MSTTTTTRWTTALDDAATEPQRALVGGKAWSLWRMTSLGLRVPPAFVITTEACSAYFDGGRTLPGGLAEEIRAGVRDIERQLGRTFGDTTAPLLVSVRSGAAISMPGMMDTILNLGMNDDVEAALATETGSAEFAADVHRRFQGLYGQLVLGSLEELGDLGSLAEVRAAISEETGQQVPVDPWAQLEAAVAAVFESSRSRRAIAYRDHHGIPQDIGTAVTIQAMVFGNLDESSGTGVLFSRNPLTGAREAYGEYLPCGQGEDVVSGRVTPQPLEALATRDPGLHAELLAATERLDTEGRDAQDIEFTVQQGVLYLLQSRAAKRTARAAVRIALELEREGLISRDEAMHRVNADQVRALLRPVVADGAADGAEVLGSGVSASPGVATGIAVGTPDEAQASPGSILVRRTTSPEDVHGMIAAAAVVTELGGSTSHAAVVSRALDTPCVVGCEGALDALVGRLVTVDATSGTVYAGELATSAVDEVGDDDLSTLLAWARERSPLTVVKEATAAPGPLYDAEADPDLDPERIPAIPSGAGAVSGSCFLSADGLRAVLEAGVTTVVAPVELPVHLTALTIGKDRS